MARQSLVVVCVVLCALAGRARAQEAAAPGARPAPPVVRRLALTELDARDGSFAIDLDAALDPDVAYVDVILRCARAAWQTKIARDRVPWHGELTCPGWAYDAPVRVVLRTFDRAGHVSEALRLDADILRAPPPTRCLRPAMTALIAELFGELALFALGLWCVVRMCRFFLARRADDPAADPEPISLLVAERLARRVRGRGGLLATLALLGGVPWFFATEHGFLVIASTIAGAIGVRSVVMARGVIRLIELGGDELRAEASERAVVLQRGDEHASIDIHVGELDRAMRFAAPIAIAKRA
ncbi:MAG TPA: hypothetical protein VFP84_22310 [Kofleriaceae bacterium]|nr:hypothetical protein [Kofleriaceae bacterium]